MTTVLVLDIDTKERTIAVAGAQSPGTGYPTSRIIQLILGAMRCLITFLLVLGPVLAEKFSVDAIVVAVDPATRTLLASHRAIAR